MVASCNYHDNGYPYYDNEDCWEYSWVFEAWRWDYDSSSSLRPSVDEQGGYVRAVDAIVGAEIFYNPGPVFTLTPA